MRRTVACLLLLASLSHAQDPAALFGEDTFCYVELDAAALEKGFAGLDIAKIIADPKFRDFFMPGFRRFELDPADPIGTILKRLGIREWVAGRVALGLRDLKVAACERPANIYTPSEPVGIAIVHELVGELLAELLKRGELGRATAAKLEMDFAAVLEPGPKLKKVLVGFLNNPPFDLKKRVVQLGERELLHLAFPPIALTEKIHYEPHFYLAIGEQRWLLATNAQVLAKMLDGGPRASLAGSPNFARARERHTGSGLRLAYCWLDAPRAIQVFSRLLSKRMAELLEKSGVKSVLGAGAGVSFVEGGIRESFGVLLEEKRQGIWSMLDAFPPGLRSIEIAPPETRALFGFKFDLRIFDRRFKQIAAVLGEKEFSLAEEIADAVDLDAEKDIEPAFGDEIGLMLFAPKKKGPTPDWVFGLDLRDTEAFGRILESIKKNLRGFVKFPESPLDENRMAFRIAGAGIEDPWCIVAKRHFFCVSRKELLLEVLDKWGVEGRKTLARDSATFARTLRGLATGKKNIFGLWYVDLKSGLPDLLQMFPVGLPRDFRGFVDEERRPDPAVLFERLAGAAAAISVDPHGVRFDVYSPVGAITLAPLWLASSGGVERVR